MRNDFHNQSAIALIVDGTADEDFHEGDAVRLIFGTEGAANIVGFDGSALSFSSDRSGTLEIDFKQTSKSLDKYERLFQLQSAGRGRKLDGFYTSSVGKSYYLEGCAVLSLGSVSSGAVAAAAQTVTLIVSRINPQ